MLTQQSGTKHDIETNIVIEEFWSCLKFHIKFCELPALYWRSFLLLKSREKTFITILVFFKMSLPKCTANCVNIFIINFYIFLSKWRYRILNGEECLEVFLSVFIINIIIFCKESKMLLYQYEQNVGQVCGRMSQINLHSQEWTYEPIKLRVFGFEATAIIINCYYCTLCHLQGERK